MYTVIETTIFQKLQTAIWSIDERFEFIEWIAQNPLSGDVIAQTGGLRKVRWARQGMGKSGGARVIYYNQLNNGTIVLLMVYAKAKFDNLPSDYLLALKATYESTVHPAH